MTNYNKLPYYNLNGYISINDDRIGRIVSFKLYEENKEIMVDFKEALQIFPLNSSRHYTKTITSLDDFKNKWNEYYNYYY
jgi:hypothetical protein